MVDRHRTILLIPCSFRLEFDSLVARIRTVFFLSQFSQHECLPWPAIDMELRMHAAHPSTPVPLVYASTIWLSLETFARWNLKSPVQQVVVWWLQRFLLSSTQQYQAHREPGPGSRSLFGRRRWGVRHGPRGLPSSPDRLGDRLCLARGRGRGRGPQGFEIFVGHRSLDLVDDHPGLGRLCEENTLFFEVTET